jgi:uncharacterized alkaline shock family protein YloU
MTGYAVNYVNIYVQGVYFDEPKVDESSGEVVEPTESTEEEPRDDNEAIDERSETQSKDQE